nr:hypothetical protein YKMJLDLN_YKMJLDLN_CDS_0003 [Microvirus sp.]
MPRVGTAIIRSSPPSPQARPAPPCCCCFPAVLLFNGRFAYRLLPRPKA